MISGETCNKVTALVVILFAALLNETLPTYKRLLYLSFRLDIFSIVSCFEDSNGVCDGIFFTLISEVSYALSSHNEINTSTWNDYRDVKATYNDKCPKGDTIYLFRIFNTHFCVFINILLVNFHYVKLQGFGRIS